VAPNITSIGKEDRGAEDAQSALRGGEDIEVR
jgi:hypothetical protein